MTEVCESNTPKTVVDTFENKGKKERNDALSVESERIRRHGEHMFEPLFNLSRYRKW